MARISPEINSGSMADISFLLLTFFLLTSSIDTDQGITRKLPPPLDPKNPPSNIDIKERNVLKVLVSKSNALLVQGKYIDIRELKETAKVFLANPQNKVDLPEMEVKDIPGLGKIRVSKGVISLKNDRGTSYKAYINVQNELAAAINELRNDLSKQKYGVKFSELKGVKSDAIAKAVPIAISEAEHENIGGK